MSNDEQNTELIRIRVSKETLEKIRDLQYSFIDEDDKPAPIVTVVSFAIKRLHADIKVQVDAFERYQKRHPNEVF